jgi:hypothetical protein
MSMRPIAQGLLICLALAAPAAAGTPARAAREADGAAAALLQRIESEGAEEVLLDIYEDDAQWQPVVRGIASGSTAWLRVGVHLKRVARAQAEELTVALSRALEKQPAGALAVLGDAFDADDVCSLNTLEQSLGADYAAALRTVERRERAVARVSDPSLLPQRDECLAFLRELKREVVRNKTSWFKTAGR